MENAELLALPAPAVTSLLTEETYTRLVETVKALGDAIVKIFRAVADAISEFVSNSLIPAVNSLMKRLYKIVAPPKLYRLAYHAKKGRTRKKNLKRIKRYWEEFINGCNKVH